MYNDRHSAAEAEAATSKLAHHLWEQAGRPEGGSQYFWKDAERKMAEAGYRLAHTLGEKPSIEGGDDIDRDRTKPQSQRPVDKKSEREKAEAPDKRDAEPRSNSDSNDEALGV